MTKQRKAFYLDETEKKLRVQLREHVIATNMHKQGSAARQYHQAKCSTLAQQIDEHCNATAETITPKMRAAEIIEDARQCGFEIARKKNEGLKPHNPRHTMVGEGDVYCEDCGKPIEVDSMAVWIPESDYWFCGTNCLNHFYLPEN